MLLPPLVERELRTGARRPAFFWLRGLLALILGFQAYELLNRYALQPRPRLGAAPAAIVTGTTMLHEMAWLVFLAVLFMGLLTADSISRERREGTLGLLLLTHISPAQIVYGKLLSCGLTGFLVLLGAMPALMVAVLAGGVSGAEAAMTAAGLLNALFVALAAGLWMSAVFRERRYAVTATLALIAALAFGSELLGDTVFGAGAVPFARLLGLTGWITAARAQALFNGGSLLSPASALSVLVRLPFLFNPLFVFWFIIMQAVGWFCLRRAAVALARSWQDEPERHFREPEPQDEWSLCAPAQAVAVTQPSPAPCSTRPIPARTSWLADPRPWDADPISWRVQQMRPAEGLMWLAVALDFLAQFGALGAIFGNGAKLADAWGLLSFAGLAVILFSSGLLAWAGARFFQDARRQQDLELLLTSPIGSRNILSGQWRVLRRALTWPLAAVLVLAVPSAIALIVDISSGALMGSSRGSGWLSVDLSRGARQEIWSVLPTFLIAVNLALEALTVCWVGIWYGLRARNLIAAVTQTVVLVQLLPLALAVALMWCWSLAADHSLTAARSRAPMPPVISALCFFLVKNIALMAWARFRLHRDLRLGTRTGRLDTSPARLVAQPA